MNKKAQSALEYLMTYGWALLIIAIVGVALYATGVLNPSTWTRTQASGFAQLGMPSTWEYTATSGAFSATFINGAGERITVTSVIYNDGTITDTDSLNTTVSAGDTFASSGTLTAVTAGDTYSVSVTVNYDDAQGSARLDSGTISGRAT